MKCIVSLWPNFKLLCSVVRIDEAGNIMVWREGPLPSTNTKTAHFRWLLQLWTERALKQCRSRMTNRTACQEGQHSSLALTDVRAVTSCLHLYLDQMDRLVVICMLTTVLKTSHLRVDGRVKT